MYTPSDSSKCCNAGDAGTALNAYQIGEHDVVVHFSRQEALMFFRRETCVFDDPGIDDVVPVDDSLLRLHVFDEDSQQMVPLGTLLAQMDEPGWLVAIDT